MKRENLLIVGFACIAVVIGMFMSWKVYGQEIQFSVNVTDGGIYQQSNYSALEVTNDNSYIQDRYQNELYAPIVDEAEFTYNFSGQAQTSLSASSSFAVPVIKNTEKIGVTEINKSESFCGQVAAGSQISVFNIDNMNTTASPGGTGPCLGVNYSIDAEEAQGMMAFGYAEHKTGLSVITTPPAEEGGEETTTTIYRKSNVMYSAEVRGQIEAFKASITAPPCPPAGEEPPGLETLLKICPWPVDDAILAEFGVLP